MQRPDLRKKIQGSKEYAEHYVASHRNISDEFAYHLGYADLLLIDSLLSDYVMLDVGCGTGGYYRLARRYNRIDGIDFSAPMIDAAKKLKIEMGFKNVEFTCDTFESFTASEKYDVIRMPGIYGWYLPWHGRTDVLNKVSSLLQGGGIAVLSYVAADTLTRLIKSSVFPSRTVAIRQNKFLAMLEAAGLDVLFRLEMPHTTLVFVQKPAI